MDNVSKISTFADWIVEAGARTWGWVGWMVMIWIASMALDYITGTVHAIATETWSSKAARDGLKHKGGEVIAVIAAALADALLGSIIRHSPVPMPFTYSVALTVLVLVWYSFTELGSILENAAKLGAPVPSWLTKGIKLSADAIDQQGNNLLPDAGHDKPPDSAQAMTDDIPKKS